MRIVILALIVSLNAFGFISPIKANLDISSFQGLYQNYSERQSISTDSVITNISYLDKAVITGKIAKTSIKFSDDFTYDQIEYYGRLKQKFYFNRGVVHLGGGYLQINPSSGTGVQAGTSLLGYSTLDKSHYIGANGGISFYQGLKIHQGSFVYSYSFNNKYDNIELNSYHIFSSDELQTNNKKSYHALVTKYTHYLKSDKLLFIDELFVSFMVGSRIYAINDDTMQMYNLPQVEKFAFTAGPSWHIKDSLRVNLRYSLNTFEDFSLNKSYKLHGAYLSINTNF